MLWKYEATVASVEGIESGIHAHTVAKVMASLLKFPLANCTRIFKSLFAYGKSTFPLIEVPRIRLSMTSLTTYPRHHYESLVLSDNTQWKFSKYMSFKKDTHRC